MTPESSETTDSVSRRRLLGVIGTTVCVGIAGCTDGTSRPTYERGTVELPADAEPRTAPEFTAAAQQAITETSDAVAQTEALELTDHAFVYEPGYLGATVQGTVENRTSGRIELAEVRVRVYDSADRLLGGYLDRVADLDGGNRWRFTAILLESPADIAAYDIAALGTPGG